MNHNQRIEQTVLLLESLDDLRPAPATWRANPLHWRREPGAPAPSRTVTCGSCKGTGRMASLRPCANCNAKGVLVVDDYTGREVRAAETEDEMPLDVALSLLRDERALLDYLRDPEGRRCDGGCRGTGRLPSGRMCSTCLGVGRLPHYEPPDVPAGLPQHDALDAFLAQLVRRWESGSWVDVERALLALLDRSRACYRLVCEVHVAHAREPGELSRAEQARLQVSLVFVEQRMPDPIKVPGWLRLDRRERESRAWLHRGHSRLAEAKRRERDALVVALRTVHDVPVPEIASRVCLSPSSVYEILARAEAAEVAA